MEYLHPSVSSKIVDNSIVFLSAQGITQLFSAFTSDLGPDNKIQMVTSPSEFLFHYGAPNMKKHGQVAYNVMNWLNAHGGVFALRVLPENAGFSHAFVNIQTKVATKKVVNKDNVLVDVSDVTIRPTVAFTGVNNTSIEALEAELARTNRPTTVDGFENNFLFAVYPKGRGKAYDNLGFRLTLTDSYDETYGFRLYNFEVTKTQDNGSTSVVDGPFLVSLSPDAVSASNESLHIKYVVEKYSVYFNLLFNESAFDTLGAVVNNEVNPSVLDFISGRTREISGSAETFFNDVTGQDEDVHLSIQKYTDGGLFTGELNFVDGTSSVESGIVDIDDSLRLTKYTEKQTTVTNMKVALGQFQNNSFPVYVTDFADVAGTGILESGRLKVAKDAFDNNYTAFTTSETGFNSASVSISEFKTVIGNAIGGARNALAQLKTGLDISRSVGESTETLNSAVAVNDIEVSLAIHDIKSAKTASKKSQLIEAETELGLAVTADSNEDKLASISNSINTADDVLSYVKSLDVVLELEANATIATAAESLTTAINYLAQAQKTSVLPENVDGLVNSALTAASDLVEDVKTALELSQLEVSIATVKTVQVKITSAMADITIAISSTLAEANAAATDVARETLSSTMEENIETAQFEADETKVDTFNLAIHDFNTFVKFSKGSDGDLDESDAALKARTTKNLLIKAYKGLIDSELTNKKLYPIDLVLDANYPVEVKGAITELCTAIRKDFIGIVDTGFTATPAQAVEWRKNEYTASTFYTSIFTQDFVVYDEFTGQDIKVTTPYFLAKKIPTVDENDGIHVPFVGPRRGTIDGFKKMSWNPTEPWKEQLYKKQINYVEADPRRTKLGSQLTSQTVVSALSNINNVRALLKIQREVEALSEDYQFEFNDETTISAFQYNLNGYLTKWTSNRACDSISGTVYASAYDRQQKQVRVKIEMVFNNIIERVLIDLVVNR